MINKRARVNFRKMMEDHPDVIADIVAAYQNGEDVSKELDSWSGFETTGEAIAEYLATLEVKPKPKPKRKRSTKTKKDAPSA